MKNLGNGVISKLTRNTNTTDETSPQQQKMNIINQNLATTGAAVAVTVGISYWKINQNSNKIHEDMEDEAVEKEVGEKETPLRVWISDIYSSGKKFLFSGTDAEAVFKQDGEKNMPGDKIPEDMEDEAVEKEVGEKDASGSGAEAGFKQDGENDMFGNKTETESGKDKVNDAKNKNEEPRVTQ